MSHELSEIADLDATYTAVPHKSEADFQPDNVASVDQVLQPIRTQLEQWWDAVGLRTSEGNMTARRLSLTIQHSIARVMREGNWNPTVETEVRTMLGGQRALIDISAAKNFIEIRS
jgi:hypothetical protein